MVAAMSDDRDGSPPHSGDADVRVIDGGMSMLRNVRSLANWVVGSGFVRMSASILFYGMCWMLIWF